MDRQASPVRLLRHARAPGWPAPRDLLIQDGRIVRIGERLPADAAPRIDLGGRAVVPGLIEAHTHLDKAFILARAASEEGTLSAAIREMARLKPGITVEDVYRRAESCLLRFVQSGATTVRTHVDVDPAIGLRGMEALVRLRERYRDRVRLQLVPLARSTPGSGDEADYRHHLRAAVALGADAVGGSPTLANDRVAHLRIAFATAAEFGLPIDLHVDESDDPGDLALETLADMTRAEGFEGRVVAGHCCSLAAVDDRVAARVIEKVARAGIAVATLPLCNLYLQGRQDAQPVRRGITRVTELLAAGVNVFCGSDNVQDPFGPYGRADTLDAAWLTGLTAQIPPSLRATLLDLVTLRPARALGLEAEHGLEVGRPADLVVMASSAVDDLVIDRPERVLVFKAGRIAATGPSAAQLGVSGPEV
jgi:cytosine deaminase